MTVLNVSLPLEGRLTQKATQEYRIMNGTRVPLVIPSPSSLLLPVVPFFSFRCLSLTSLPPFFSFLSRIALLLHFFGPTRYFFLSWLLYVKVMLYLSNILFFCILIRFGKIFCQLFNFITSPIEVCKFILLYFLYFFRSGNNIFFVNFLMTFNNVLENWLLIFYISKMIQ